MTERQTEKQSLNAILAPDILFSFASRWGSYLWQRKQQQKQHWGKMIPTISPHNRLLSPLKTLTATSSPSFFLEQKQVLLAVRYIFFCFRLRDFWVVSTVCTTVLHLRICPSSFAYLFSGLCRKNVGSCMLAANSVIFAPYILYRVIPPNDQTREC